MSFRNGNNIGRTAQATPAGDSVVSSLSRSQQVAAAITKSNVMDTLLGRNKLAALDDSGSDPYNATGRQFRR
jgi:hypothetical protein